MISIRKIKFLFVIWFFLSPVFWHLNISKGSSGYYDVFSMAPYGWFHLIIFYLLGFVSVYLSGVSLYHILLFNMYFLYIQLSNYPYMTMRDVFLHSSPTQTILTYGQINYPSDPAPSSWPDSFYIYGILSIVSCVDLIPANYILYILLVIVFSLFVYSIAMALKKKSPRIAWISVLLFSCLFFNHLLDNFHHYSRTALAFTLMLFFVFCIFRFNSKQGSILLFLITFAIVATHPFQSLAVVALVIAYLILYKKERLFGLSGFSIVLFVGWMVFQGSSTFNEAVDRLKTFMSPQYVKPIAETIPIKEALPLLGSIFRYVFRISLSFFLFLGLFSVLVIFFRRKTVDKLTAGLIALLFSSSIMFFGLLFLPDWTIDRFSSFAAFPAGLSSLMLFKEALNNSIWTSKVYTFFGRRRLYSILLLLVVCLSAIVMALRFERNYYFGELYHPSEISSLSFVFGTTKNITINIISWRTYIYAIYFNWNATNQILRIWYLDLNAFGNNASMLLQAEILLINKSQLIVRGMRDSFTFSRQQSPEAILAYIDQQVIFPKFNSVYSNEYYLLFKRIIF